MQCFANDKRFGSVRYGAIHWRIGVNASRTNDKRIGDATEVGMTLTGLALWRLRVHGDEVPGLWVLIDGQFVLADKVPG
jgi:hypothetical protein